MVFWKLPTKGQVLNPTFLILKSDFTTLNLNPLHTGTCTVQLFMNFVVHRWLEMCLAFKESVSKPDVILLLVILEPPTNIGAV